MANRGAEGSRPLRATADERLAALREATDAKLRDELLEELLTVDAPPVIDGALSRRHASIDRGDRDDLRAQVLVRLLRRLMQTGEPPVERFGDYVAIVTYHAVDDYVRARNPQGAFAANRIRYVLRHDHRFAVWESGGETVCGLAEWKVEDRQSCLSSTAAGGAGWPVLHDAAALERFFVESGGPVPLRVLLALVRERVPAPRAVPAAEDSAFEGVAVRQLLGKLWQEIVELPQAQRVALLLHLRDGPASGALSELPRTGVASAEAIAVAVGWSVEELAARWQELPFDDDRIAALLDVTRQQVINLRKAARARLARRLARRNV